MTEERLAKIEHELKYLCGSRRPERVPATMAEELVAEVRALQQENEHLQGQAWATMCATLRVQRDEARARVTELEIYQAGLLDECQQLREKARMGDN